MGLRTMRCDRCGEQETALFKAGFKGELGPWFCQDCMVETGHAPEVEELADIVRLLKMMGREKE